jgi:WD40 repeat protein
MMDNKDASKDQNMKNDIAHENQIIMNNLIRSELLGQSVNEYSLDVRLDGQIKSPSRKGETSSSNLFKYRYSTGSTQHSSSPLSDPHHHSLGSSGEFASSGASFSAPNSPANRQTHLANSKKNARKISKTPFKVLDAPQLQDDYYLNLVDWSHSNLLSVALGSSVYLWSASTSKVTKLCDIGPDDSVTSITWAQSGQQIAVGTNTGKVQLWDSTQCKVVRELCSHESRVGTMAWNTTLLATGSRDRNIYLQDTRVRGVGSSSSSSHAGSSSSPRVTSREAATLSSIIGNALGGGSSSLIHNNEESYPRSDFDAAEQTITASSSSYDAASSSSTDSTGDRIFPAPVRRGGGSISGSSVSSDSIPLSLSNPPYRPSPLSMPPPSPPTMFSGASTSSHSSSAYPSPSTQSCLVQQLHSHKQEVCGLKWSSDEKMLASGGNDNKLFVWEAQHGGSRGTSRRGGNTNSEPLCRFEDHSAAVKAVAWSPHQHGLLASGGGTADRHIRFWNALTAQSLHKIDTGSQVCNLMWSKNVNEIVSTHGYSLNQVIVWKYPSMVKIATLTGHSLRVLYLAMSPDGQSVVTGAGDETLRFWNLFPPPRNKTGYRMGPSILAPTGADIR